MGIYGVQGLCKKSAEDPCEMHAKSLTEINYEFAPSGFRVYVPQ